MATSGKLTTSAWKNSTNRTRYLELSWERTAVNVAEQTTTIKWTLIGKGTYGGYVMSAPFTVVIDGSTVYSSNTRIKLYAEQEVASGTTTIKHNANGTKTFSASVKAAIYWSDINVSGSGSYTLDIVGTASITKAPNFNDEQNPTIEYENPVGNVITSLQAAISLTGANPDVSYRDVSITNGKYTFNLTEAERNVLRAATVGSSSRKVRFYLRSVIDGKTYFSWKEVSFTVINALPTIEASVIDTNTQTATLTGDSTTLIRNYSTAAATISAYPQKEATITNVRIEHNGGFTTAEVAYYPNVESNVFAFSATDSRGSTVYKTIVSQMIDYIIPTANIDDTELMDTEGNYTLKCSGNYYNDTFGYTDAAQPNQLSIMYRYKAQGGSYGDWVYIMPTLNGNGYTAETTITGLDYRTTYIFECQAVDKLNSVLSAEATVRSIPIFHWSNTDFVFEVPVKFNAGTEDESSITAEDIGALNLLYITEDEYLISSGDDMNNYITPGAYRCPTAAVAATLSNITSYVSSGFRLIVSATSSTKGVIQTVIFNTTSTPRLYWRIQSSSGSWGEWYRIAAETDTTTAAAGKWIPELTTDAAVSGYSLQEGWYQQIGDTITIGWQLKATIKSGYNSTTIGIRGCPKNPSYSAFGGGVAHNVYMIAGYNFEGWCIGTDGIITLRGQPCNNTAAANLQINSSAYYPTGSNTTITLAGTICYYAGLASEG